ncbi:MAG: S41 family peptidase [Planctomycetota bacterium]
MQMFKLVAQSRLRFLSCNQLIVVAITLLAFHGSSLGQTATETPLEVGNAATEVDEAGEGEVADANDEYELMKLFVDTLDEVQRNYVKPISRRKLMEAAIEGVLTKLDVYSDYIAPEDIEDFRRDVESEFGGIGVQVNMKNGVLSVLRPLYGTPGMKAGLKPGDMIEEVDGQPTVGFNLDDAVNLMKGRIGTSVRLKVRHPSGKVETLDVKREVIRVETVISQQRGPDGSWDFILDDFKKIAYIRITSFSGHTGEELEAALEQVKKEGMKGLVLDLRLNPGGLLPTAIEVCDMFLEKGRIVSTSGRRADAREWDAKSKGSYVGFPMVVLVNAFSASASEIVSACLQDNDRAVVVGQRTWGKGSVQKVIELEEGRSALKLTTSTYLRPNGKNIHRFESMTEADEWGVQPSPGMEVRMTLEQVENLRDAFYKSAAAIPGEPQPTIYIDAQLERALNHLKSQIP